jgi:antitoxin component HigA of HigAB toxin-antitoxin module
MSLITLYGEMQDTYLALIRLFPRHPIRSEDERNEAMEILDTLVGKETLTIAEADYPVVLSDLVEQYEEQAHAISPASDAELLQHLIKEQETTPDHIAKATGIALATLEAVLVGTQRLTRQHIGRLARHFHVPPSVFTFGE